MLPLAHDKLPNTATAGLAAAVHAAPPSLDRSQPLFQVNENVFTWANIVTALRAVLGAAVFAVAAITHSDTWNFAGLAIYWVLDILDGFLARWLKQETRLGAQLDIFSDRLLVAFFYMNYLSMRPGLVVPITLFLMQFMVIDQYLSNQFMRWPILSPNYFYKVDSLIWKLNWSPVAKALNTGLVTILLIVTNSVWLPILAALCLTGVKIFSFVRLQRVPLPEGHWPLSNLDRNPR